MNLFLPFQNLKKYSLIFFLFASSLLSAQTTFSKIYYDSINSFLHDVMPTSDGGAILFARQSSLVLTKIDCKGDIEWNTSLNYQGFSSGEIVETSNGDFLVIFPFHQSSMEYRTDIGIIKFDSSGDIIWEKKYGQVSHSEFPSTIVETLDGGFVISGNIENTILNYSNLFFFKIDATGSQIWAKDIDENTHSRGITASQIDNDGNIIHLGDKYNNDTCRVSFILKMNPQGDIFYLKEIQNSSYETVIHDVTLTLGGDYLGVGSFRTSDTTRASFITKFNPNGNLIYSKNLGYPLTVYGESIQSIITTQDGNYALAGLTDGFPQYTDGAKFSDLIFIATLDENEKYINSRIYNQGGNIFQPNFLHLVERTDETLVLGLSHFSYSDSSNIPITLTAMGLDHNLSNGCNDYDATDNFSLEEISGWTLIDLPFTETPHEGESDFFQNVVEDYPYDSVFTICQSDLEADFTIKNICPDQPINFFDQSLGPIISQEWDFDYGAFFSDKKNPSYQFSGSGIFPIQLTVSDGCQMDTLIQEIEIPEECICEMIFPNAFTPNQDGVNDFFQPIIDCDFIIENYKLLLFNRWGQLVFESNNPDEKWDGKFRKKAVPSDVLIFKVQYEVKDEFGILIRQVNETGDVTLIR